MQMMHEDVTDATKKICASDTRMWLLQGLHLIFADVPDVMEVKRVPLIS